MFSRCKAPRMLIGALLAMVSPVQAQFKSGSTEVDGALDYSNQAPGTTVLFNPATFNHTASNTVYNFTTINIPVGVTVRLSGNMIAGPVIWLASGNVQIAGNADLSGGSGTCDAPTECRSPSVPGAGGYPGGVGGDNASIPPEPGLGPGGGAAGAPGIPSKGGTFTGTSILVPLVGGSGGGGYWGSGGGGAGGGALFIASSTSINLTGTINASGGNGPSGGSGGAIRLAATSISGSDTGFLYACGGSGFSSAGTSGITRVESFNGASFRGCGNPEYTGAPFSTLLSSPAPATVTVTNVNGAPVTLPPSGSFQTPDVMVNSAGPLQFAISATNVPVGSTVTMQFYSDNGPDLFVQSTPLKGTLTQSSATAEATLPTGYTRALAFTSFTGPAPNVANH